MEQYSKKDSKKEAIIIEGNQHSMGLIEFFLKPRKLIMTVM
jgi:hypothetical protein